VRTITISDELYASLKAKLQENIEELQDLVGKAWFFRTVTYHMTGRVVKIVAGQFLVLEEAAWIADSGRFADAIKTGELSEVEPVGDGVLINIQTVTDIFPWRHELPKVRK